MVISVDGEALKNIFFWNSTVRVFSSSHWTVKGYNLDTKCAAHFPFVTRKDLYGHACRWLSYRHDCWWLLQIVWFDRWKLDCFFFTSTGKDLLTFASHDIIIMVADDCYTDMLAGDCWRLFDQIGSNWLPSDYSQPVKAASTFHMERILMRIDQILPLLIPWSFSYDLFSSIETWLLQDCTGCFTPVYEPNYRLVYKRFSQNGGQMREKLLQYGHALTKFWSQANLCSSHASSRNVSQAQF